ncbi:MAG TPA: hypothetical protein VG826_15755 [Pirellulales bacterium]|nr:hypothetical protein [Pirellulales bacterium]
MLDQLHLVEEAQRNEQYQEAHAILVECLESARNVRAYERLANALLLFADNLLEWCPEGDDPFERRKMAAEEALKLFSELADKRGEARALLILATVDRERSFELANGALALARQLGDKAITAQAMRYLGNHASIAGQTREALEMASEAVRLAEESGDAELLAEAAFVLGVVTEDQAARIEAFETMARLEARYRRKRRFASRLAAAAGMIADQEQELAIAWNNRCLAIARAVSDPRFEGSVLRGLAQIERARGNTDKAEELEAMSNVMCPLPDMTELVKGAENRDMGMMSEAVKAMLGIR